MSGGTIFENIKYGNAFKAQALSSGTEYNDVASSVTQSGIDTKDYDEIVFVVDHSAIDAFSAVAVSIVGSASDDPATAVLVALNDESGIATNASFGAITNEAAGQEYGFIQCKSSKRYLWAKTVISTTATCYANINYIMGKADTVPVSSQTADFEIGF
jgi:hypothetical protein